MREIQEQATNARNGIVNLSSQLVSEREMRFALSMFDPVWDSLTPQEQTHAMRQIVKRVGYDPIEGSVSIEFQPAGIRTLAEQVTPTESSREDNKEGTISYVHIGREKYGRRRLLAGRAPDPECDPDLGNIPRIARLMALAIHLEGLLERGEVKDMAEIARLGHVTRARVTQIMNLRLLAPDIQEAILNLPPTISRDSLLYKHIQPLTTAPTWLRQRKMWAHIKSARLNC